MMRIALFLPSLCGGGAERVMVNLAQGLTEAGNAVDLVLARADGPYLARVRPPVRVVDLRAGRVLAGLRALSRYLRREQPTVLLSALNHANLTAIWARRLAKVSTRVYVSVHSNLTRATAQSGNMRDKAMPWLIRRYYPAADGVVAVSHGVAEDLLASTGLPEQLVHVIYNPVVSPEIRTLACQSVAHPWLAEMGPPVILGVGRMVAAKDFANLLRAFAYVRQRRMARLVIIGDGEERTQLEKLAVELGVADDVDFPGFVANPYAYMARAGVFVLSSAWEGLPVALIEALAVGVPVVATDCRSGPREILANGRYGALVPVRAPEQLGEAIFATLAHPTTPAPPEAWASCTLPEATRAYLALFAGELTHA